MSVAHHSVYNALGAAVPLAVTIFTIPLYLSIIGPERYGVLSICWLLLGYFNLFDFGLGRAVAQKIASLASASPSERSRIFWTAAMITGALALVATLIFGPAAQLGISALRGLTPELQEEFQAALPYLIFALPFGVVHSLLVGALEGRRQFLAINLVVSLSTALTALLPLAAAYLWQPTLPYLLLAALAARTISTLLLIVLCKRQVPVQMPETPRRQEVKSLLSFGGWTTVSAVIGPLLVFWDRFAIGAMIGSAAVAYYVVAFNLVSQLQILPNSLTTALFPRLAQLAAAEARQLRDEATFIVLAICTPITLVVLVAVGPFLLYWLGAETAELAMPVASILLIGFWANSLARIAAVELQAGGRPKVIALVHLAELAPYAVVLLLALNSFGIVGAALVWSLRCIVDAGILYWLAGVTRKTVATMLLHALVLAISTGIAYRLPPLSGTKIVILLGSLVVTLFLIARDPPTRLVDMLKRRLPSRWAR